MGEHATWKKSWCPSLPKYAFPQLTVIGAKAPAWAATCDEGLVADPAGMVYVRPSPPVSEEDIESLECRVAAWLGLAGPSNTVVTAAATTITLKAARLHCVLFTCAPFLCVEKVEGCGGAGH
jgi:hypothetical protein